MEANDQLIDALTGLTNRKGFEEQLKEAILLTSQNDSPLSLAFLDIDHFKLLNDTLGHDSGDTLISSVGTSILNLVGNHGSVCRYGGEEYTIIFPNTEREQAFLIVEQIRNKIDGMQSFSSEKNLVKTHLTISGGISACPIDASEANELLRKADQALYKAKLTGRNKIMLAFEEKMAPKTSHYTLTQLERLGHLAQEQGVGEAVLLREALDNLLIKYKHAFTAKR